MAKQLQLRRGTTAQHNTFTGAVGEVTIDTDKDVVVVHDGATAGGFPSQKQLVSGTNIKTINDTSLLGSGNISIGISGLSDTSISSPLSGQVLSYNGINWANVTLSALDAYSKEDTDILLAAKQPTLVSGTNIKTVGGISILGSGDIASGGLPQNSQTFTSSSTFTVPAGITKLFVRTCGGGAGGAGGWYGYGGPSAGYINDIISVSPGSTLTVIIGAGGAGGAATQSALPSALGGSGGTSSVTGAIPSQGAVPRTTTTSAIPGSGGGVCKGGTTDTDTSALAGYPGGTGPSRDSCGAGGAGGAGGNYASGQAGQPGKGIGAGGAGGNYTGAYPNIVNLAGGAGYRGQVIIYW